MKWVKLTENNIPSHEVLCGNFNKGTFGYKEKLIGYVIFDGEEFYCDNDTDSLGDVSHYIDIHDFEPVE